jgi:hypothetical protein
MLSGEWGNLVDISKIECIGCRRADVRKPRVDKIHLLKRITPPLREIQKLCGHDKLMF